MKLTPEQIHILQHSHGVDQYGRGKQYRNRYIIGPECDGVADLVALVDAGLMIDHGPRKLAGGMHWFAVTQAGIDAVALQSPKPPELTRSQQRYKRYLEVADCFSSFRAFLAWDCNKERSWNT
ncbi:hypothetical protein [Ereboglobus luteus]|uniref:Uncharacterized protein n=1 Tax=Ereboglobus luteus TaxID=1796921 RepID=A0A2U8E553_9BACT|nr:hypothetical protein [Ereboglobus luteus]AWI09987.1 hypothetical protein CKA38_12660 [Ereboglobus luteus]